MDQKGELKIRKEAVRKEIETNLSQKVASDPKLHNVYLLVHSEKLDIHWSLAAGDTDGIPADPRQPYHTASIGKTFTSVILAKLVEQGLVRFEDPIANYLPETLLKDLHTYKGKDYVPEIQIKHLVSNTSGLPDYYEDKPRGGQARFMDEVLANPSRFWTAEETIAWSKEYLRPRFPPGKGLHYSDTGFNLLGLIIESVTSKPYHEVLHDYIFTPLGMNNSYLSHYSDPADDNGLPVANIHLKDLKIKVEDYRSFSSFYAGGQTVSTSEDLLTFLKALVNYRIVRKETWDTMLQWNKMWLGMEYGYGLMRLHFIPFTRKYIGWGHLGSSGSAMLYFPVLDIYIMGSFNQTAYLSKSMNYIFVNVLRKLEKHVRG